MIVEALRVLLNRREEVAGPHEVDHDHDWYGDFKVRTTGGGRQVVYLCPSCDSPRVYYCRGSNPTWRCTEDGCPRNYLERGKRTRPVSTATSKLSTIPVDEYKQRYLNTGSDRATDTEGN